MSDTATGTVTFLFTDIEGSTGLWEEYPEAVRLWGAAGAPKAAAGASPEPCEQED